jgi:hypothetical protein
MAKYNDELFQISLKIITLAESIKSLQGLMLQVFFIKESIYTLKYDYGDCIEAFQGNPLFIDIIKFKV